MSISKDKISLLESVPAFLVEIGAITPCVDTVSYHNLEKYSCFDEIEIDDEGRSKWADALANPDFRKAVDACLAETFPAASCERCNPQ